MAEKIVLDTGPLISLSVNCLCHIFKELKAEFFITDTVKEESIDHGITNREYALGAIRIKNLIETGTVKIYPDSSTIWQGTDILELMNSIYSTKFGNMVIIQKGEASAIALAKRIGSRTLIVDERTTKLMIEEPYLMASILEQRTSKKIFINKAAMAKFQGIVHGINVLRSADLIAMAYEKGIIKGDNVLWAALWAAKLSGCALSSPEIQEYLDECHPPSA